MSTTLVFLAITSTAWLVWRWLTPSPKVDVPYLQFEGDNSAARYVADSGQLVAEGYSKYIKNGEPFSMRNAANPDRPLVVLPPKYLDEVRRAPQSKLDLGLYFEKNNMLREIGDLRITNEVAHAMRLDLNRSLDILIEPMQEQCLRVFAKEVPPCPDWTPISPFPIILQLFAHMSSRVLVGPEAYGDEWVALSLQFVGAGVQAPGVVREKYHPWFRWTAKYFNPVIRSLYAYRYQAAELLRIPLEARLLAAQEEANTYTAGKHAAPANRKYNDGIQWLVDAHNAKGNRLTPETLAKNLFVLGTASIHSTSATAMSILLDIIDHPEDLADIRQEIAQVKAKHTMWTRRALQDLRFLDSFMRESVRIHTLAELTVVRMAPGPYTFQDGFHLPAGTQICFPSHQYSLDPVVHTNPTVFDAKRHLRKREEADPTKFHFASTSDDTLNWGSGTHACPGRFLAQDTIKLILVHLLMNYDIKWPLEGPQGRPEDRSSGFNIIPPVGAQVLLKEKSFW